MCVTVSRSRHIPGLRWRQRHRPLRRSMIRRHSKRTKRYRYDSVSRNHHRPVYPRKWESMCPGCCRWTSHPTRSNRNCRSRCGFVCVFHSCHRLQSPYPLRLLHRCLRRHSCPSLPIHRTRSRTDLEYHSCRSSGSRWHPRHRPLRPCSCRSFPRHMRLSRCGFGYRSSRNSERWCCSRRKRPHRCNWPSLPRCPNHRCRRSFELGFVFRSSRSPGCRFRHRLVYRDLLPCSCPMVPMRATHNRVCRCDCVFACRSHRNPEIHSPANQARRPLRRHRSPRHRRRPRRRRCCSCVYALVSRSYHILELQKRWHRRHRRLR